MTYNSFIEVLTRLEIKIILILLTSESSVIKIIFKSFQKIRKIITNFNFALKLLIIRIPEKAIIKTAKVYKFPYTIIYTRVYSLPGGSPGRLIFR